MTYTLTQEQLDVISAAIFGALARNGHLFHDRNTSAEREHLAQQRALLQAGADEIMFCERRGV